MTGTTDSSAAHADIPVLVGKRVLVRPGSAGDVPDLERIRREPAVWRWWRQLGEGEIETDLRAGEGDQLLVIEVAGKVTGGIQFSEQDEPDYRHAGIDIFLSTTAQGRGLGAAAIRLLAGYLIRERGHHRLVIDPAADNLRAIRCYESVGFRPVGIMRQYERGLDGSFHDGLLMDLLAADLT